MQGAKNLGVHSETGRLRQVIVCRPGFAHGARLAVEQAQKDHDSFVALMRSEGVEVLDLNDLLAETFETEKARAWVLDHRLVPDSVGVGIMPDLRIWMDELPATLLAQQLLAGVTVDELPFKDMGLLCSVPSCEYVIPPLPNAVFTRDASAWIFDGVSVNPMFCAPRRPEALLMTAIYKFHPKFAGQVTIHFGDATVEHGLATIEGRDILPLGEGTVLVGMGGRTSPQGVEQLAEALFDTGAARRVLGISIPKSSGDTHLNSVFSLCGGDVVLARPEVADTLLCYDIRPGEGAKPLVVCRDPRPVFDIVAEVLGFKHLTIVPADDTASQVLALRAGMVISDDRNTQANAALKSAGVEVLAFPGGGTRNAWGGPHSMSCPTARDPV